MDISTTTDTLDASTISLRRRTTDVKAPTNVAPVVGTSGDVLRFNPCTESMQPLQQ